MRARAQPVRRTGRAVVDSANTKRFRRATRESERVNHVMQSSCNSMVIDAAQTVRLRKGRPNSDPYRRLLSALAAAVTSGANRGPGRRVSRSTGPDTEIAAVTAPTWSNTGADTEATPASRWPTE